MNITIAQLLLLGPSARRAAVRCFHPHLRERALANLDKLGSVPADLRMERADYVLTLLPWRRKMSPAARRAEAVARRARHQEQCYLPLGRGGSQRPSDAHLERMEDVRAMRRLWSEGPHHVAVTNEYASAVIAAPDVNAHRFETLARRVGKPVGWGWGFWARRNEPQ